MANITSSGRVISAVRLWREWLVARWFIVFEGGKARIQPEEIVDHLNSELRKALEQAVLRDYQMLSFVLEINSA